MVFARNKAGFAILVLVLLAACLATAGLLTIPAYAQDEGSGQGGQDGQGELMTGADNLLNFAMKLVAIALLVAGIMSILRHHVVGALIVILAGALILGVGGSIDRLVQFGTAIFDLIFGG